jgi:hypothetical protein
MNTLPFMLTNFGLEPVRQIKGLAEAKGIENDTSSQDN